MILMNILIFLPHLSMVTATTEVTLDHEINKVGKAKLSDGTNLVNLREEIGDETKNYLYGKGNVGIVLEIENYSGLLLTNVVIYEHAGWKDRTYVHWTGHPHDVSGTEREVFLYHNRNWLGKTSSGAISGMVRNIDNGNVCYRPVILDNMEYQFGKINLV
eukprot:GFUD01022707.1.p1 GENE.GFUD01022707.1~~GFUD01022707.1.p1  ORF type:complete len:160 (+),score=17.77 GFUD01022707.1:54-533(+)